MYIDYSGGIIVGAEADEIQYDEDKYESFYDWMEDSGMESFSRWYDAPTSGQVVGFSLDDKWPVDELDKLIKQAREKAEEFFKLTGIKASLYGMQDIY